MSRIKFSKATLVVFGLILIGAGCANSSETNSNNKQAISTSDTLYQRKLDCYDRGLKRSQEYEKLDGSKNTMTMPPNYKYNEDLQTCLYYHGDITIDVGRFAQRIYDLYTGDIVVSSTCTDDKCIGLSKAEFKKEKTRLMGDDEAE